MNSIQVRKGFGMPAVLGIIVVIAVIAGIGYYASRDRATDDGVGDEDTIVQSDGTMVKPDGTMIKPDGTMIKPDGTMVKPDGTMVKPDGTMVKPDGTMVLPDGTMVPPDPGQTTPPPAAEPPGAMMEYAGSLLAGSKAKAPLYDFKKADYDKELATGKLVVLYFYANWCPICRVEVPQLEGAFNDLATDNVIGFRVNFNDSDTDADEIALAREFGVPYQHTKIFLKNGERVLKSPETWDKARYLSEINKFVNS